MPVKWNFFQAEIGTRSSVWYTDVLQTKSYGTIPRLELHTTKCRQDNKCGTRFNIFREPTTKSKHETLINLVSMNVLILENFSREGKYALHGSNKNQVPSFIFLIITCWQDHNFRTMSPMSVSLGKHSILCWNCILVNI